MDYPRKHGRGLIGARVRLLLLVAFCGLAAAADAVCNALETLCDRWSIPEDVGGTPLTIELQSR